MLSLAVFYLMPVAVALGSLATVLVATFGSEGPAYASSWCACAVRAARVWAALGVLVPLMGSPLVAILAWGAAGHMDAEAARALVLPYHVAALLTLLASGPHAVRLSEAASAIDERSSVAPKLARTAARWAIGEGIATLIAFSAGMFTLLVRHPSFFAAWGAAAAAFAAPAVAGLAVARALSCAARDLELIPPSNAASPESAR